MALAGVACGVILLLAFRRFMDRRAAREWKRKRRAYVLGLYLFGDDPLNSLRSFGQIARANAMLLLHALPALAVAAPLIAAAIFGLDRYEASARLKPSGAAVVTTHWTGACEPRLDLPAGMRMDSPAVHIPAVRDVSWRVRIDGKWSGAARAGCGGKWVGTRLESATPEEPWVLWFGLIAWATSWLLSVSGHLFRLLA
jgi:hypothetical protein